MCTETPFPCARQRSLMWLPVLQLRHGRRSCDAAPELSAEEGSDPPLRDASIGIGEGRHVHTMPPFPAGSLPTIDPCGKAVELLTQTASRIWAGIAVVLAGSLGLSVWRVWLQPQVGSPSATAQSGRSPTWASNGMSRSGTWPRPASAAIPTPP